jgi:uncharacterized membrane protein YeiH
MPARPMSLPIRCGAFALAVSGAVAARQRRLDLFGIASVAFMVACGSARLAALRLAIAGVSAAAGRRQVKP